MSDAPADLGAALRWARGVLAAAGVPSPDADAVALAAHLRGESYGQVRTRAVLGAPTPEGYADLVARRAARVPLQHLTGRAAFRRRELAVGPGVFVPRPETEGLVELALAELAGLDAPLVVDLATGSGAIAGAVADECPRAEVWAVERSADALPWAERNLVGTGVRLVAGDATTALEPLRPLLGRVDVVTCNPPYIPEGMIPRDPEVAEHDPALALYGGSADGLAIPLAMAARAAELLRPGGLLLMEHADAQGEGREFPLPAALRAQGPWADVADHADLAGRPRVSAARRG